jgi:uncharacterized iron-regulated membrane protein
MKTLRTVVFWLHLAAGTSLGLVILVMSATGAVLALKPQVLNLVDHDVRFVTPPVPGAARLSPARLLAAARSAKPDARPVSLLVDRDSLASAAVGFGRETTLFVDPYTGHVLGEGSKGAQRFFRSMEDWHRWLAAPPDVRATARAVTGAATLAFAGLAVSGLYLWWPRKWCAQHVRAIVRFKRGVRGRARDFNWHNVIGFWCAPIVVILCATGAVMAYPWANRLLFRAMGSPPPATAAVEVPAARPDRVEAHASAEDVGLLDQVDALWERADAQLPTWQTMTMRLPAREGAPVLFVMSDARSWNAFARSQLSLDAATGAVRQWAPYDASTLGQKARGWARYAHTGELGGVLAQILAGLACLGGVVLVWTGLGLSARRFLGWRPVRSRLRSSRSGLPAATRIG